MKSRPVRQQVTVDLDRFDDGLRDTIRRAAGAPAKARVIFHEGGVRLTWHKTRRAL